MTDRAENIRNLKKQASEKKIVKGIAKIGEKKMRKLSEQLAIMQKDMDVYIEIWNKRSHTCICCGVSLGNKFIKSFAHHLLEKHERGDLRHNPENIVLVCRICHDQYHISPNKPTKLVELAEEIEKKYPVL